MILITGANGYIGTVLRSIIPEVQFIGLDSGIKPCPLGEVQKGVVIPGDINDIDLLRYLFKTYSFSHVVNLAAIVGDPACAKYPEEAEKSNVLGPMRLIEVINDEKDGMVHFIQASTCSVYGFNDREVDEDSETNPISLYAKQKVSVEDEIQSKLLTYHRGHKYTILRFATAFGWSPCPRFDLTVNEFTRDLFFDNPLEVFREDDWRPYCHVQDIAQFIMLAMNVLPAGEIYNVGWNFNNATKKKLVSIIQNVLLGTRDAFNVKFVEGDGSDPRNYKVDFGKVINAMADNHRHVPRFLPWGITEGVKDLITHLKMGGIDAYSKLYRSDHLNV